MNAMCATATRNWPSCPSSRCPRGTQASKWRATLNGEGTMRPLDYDGKNDGLYPRCMCGASWSAHDETGRCPTQLIGTSEAGAVSRVQRYRPMIGKFGRTKNKPLKTYSEVFGHPFDEDALYEADDAGARFISKYDDEVFKAEHSITIRQATMVAMAAHGIKCFPDECCGFVLGRYLSGCCDDAGCPYLDDMEEVRPITNINRYKGGAYLMHPGQQIKTLAEMELRGMKLKVVFHSHP